LKIIIETIPHERHRYPTVGDWWRDADGTVQIRVSELGNENYEWLVGLHELIEMKLCEVRGVTDSVVSRFDRAFEQRRQADNKDEPGDEKNAPYRDEHCAATGVERLLCAMLHISWQDYDMTVMALP
jgi:hypothetical protein